MPDPESLAAVWATTARSLLCRTRMQRAVTSCSSMPARIWRITSACERPMMVWLKKSANAGEMPSTTSSERVPGRAAVSPVKVIVLSVISLNLFFRVLRARDVP